MTEVRLDHPRLITSEGHLPLVYGEVHAERIRAHAKHGAKGNSREDAYWLDGEWLPILMEELGEVAHEMTYDADHARVSDPAERYEQRREAMHKELVQVAAMACAWIAAIEATA